jgi:trk system potassium uptake protein TrkA
LAEHDRASDAVLVIGLGKFGIATATALTRLGHEVLAVDDNPDVVQEWAGVLTHVIEADSTSLEAMRQVGADEFSMAVVAIGNDIEASILSTLNLEDLGVKEIWAKAITAAHGRILERIGADHVVYPEKSMGERVAHLLTGKMIDFIEFDDGFAIAKTHAPREAFGRSLGDVKLRTKYGITVVGVKGPHTDFVHAVPETVVHPGDMLIVSGRTDLVEKFSAST